MAIKINPAHKGLLHKKLGVPADKPIPPGKLLKAEHSKSTALRREAQFAANSRTWKHK
jgi:hypothetical protein